MERRAFIELATLGLLGGVQRNNPTIELFPFPSFPKNRNLSLESMVLLETESHGFLKDKRPIHQLYYGTGIVYKDNILTLDHVLRSPDTFVEGDIQYKIKIEKEEIKIYKTAIVMIPIVRDEQEDYAILKLPEKHNLKSYPHGLGDSDKIEIGQRVYLVGRPNLHHVIVREAIVASFVIKRENSIYGHSGFYIDTPAVEGDSGGYVADRETGKILGLMAERHYNFFGYIRPINLFKKHLK